MAAAVAAEERHQQVSSLPSPLTGLSYELKRGEYDLFRFVESETDELVALTALRALELRREELVEFRDALTQDDFYTLLTFARRVAVRVLRGHADQLSAGWAAVGLVDSERVDWRDAAVATGLLGYCAARTDTDPRAAVSRALTIAEPGMVEIIRRYVKSAHDGLSVGGYREIETADGPALVSSDGEPFDPTIDLLSVAGSLTQIVEADEYRVTHVTTGTRIADVWLPSASSRSIEKIRQGIRACLSISAAPQTEVSAVFPPHMLLAFIAECATAEHALLLTRAAKQSATSKDAALAVTQGRLCVVVVARSTVEGIGPIESTDRLERFREPIANALIAE